MTITTDYLTLLLHFLSPSKSHEEQLGLLESMGEGDWPALIEEARRQNVETLLYLKFSKLSRQHTCPAALMDGMRNNYLLTARLNAISLHNAGMLMKALKQSGLDVIALKGIYLLENLYRDIAARTMSDIDILVPKEDLAPVLEILEGQGYVRSTYYDFKDPNTDIKHIPPMTKPGSPPVEVHWTLLEEDEPFSIDEKGLWERAKPAKIAEVEVLGLGIEDLILHLSLHQTYQHFLSLGLRGLYDVALVIHQHRGEISWAKLVEIARSWQAEKVVALTLALVSELLGVETPEEVQTGLLYKPITPEILAQARMQLLNKQQHQDHITPDLVELAGQNNIIDRVRLGLSRLFLSRLVMARLYGVSPNSPRILLCYFRRLGYLVSQYGRLLLKIGAGDETLKPALDDGKLSSELHTWMRRVT